MSSHLAINPWAADPARPVRLAPAQPGDARNRVDTPCLILDLDAFEHNLMTMAAVARAHGVGLRPHAKTHKCRAIAERQMAAGAIGICCAKVSEAEHLAGGAVDTIHMTAPVGDMAKLVRLVPLARALRSLSLVVDSDEGARRLSATLQSAGVHADVLVDIDVGQHRTGVTSIEDALSLATLVDGLPGLRLSGIQGYAGQLQHVASLDERRPAMAAVTHTLATLRDAMRARGLRCEVVTGSGTGSHDFDAASGVFTDLQVGSYLFGDTDYDAVRLVEDGNARFRNALFVATQILSNRHAGEATTDAGSKSFALDGPSPRVVRGAPAGAGYAKFGDQFGRLWLPPGAPAPELGARLEFVPPHCDPTVNLYDHFVCVRGERVEAIWPIDARGAIR